MSEVYLMNIEQLNADKLEEYYRFLGKERIEKVERLKRIVNKKQSIACGMLINDIVLNKAAGGRDAEYSVDEYGKPHVICNGEDEIYFNVSHSGSYAILAIGKNDIGIDIQDISKTNLVIVDRCFSENEKKRLLCAKSSRLDAVYTSVWSGKESYVKALGIGIRTDLSKVDLQSVECDENEEYNIELVSLPDMDEYAISVCHTQDDEIENIYVANMKQNGKLKYEKVEGWHIRI